MIPVTLMMAMTADGKIAKDKSQLADWTSKEDKKLFVEISKEHGVVIMGGNTFATFTKPLPNRLNVVFSENDGQDIEGLLKWVKGEPETVLNNLENLGYQKALLGGGAYLNTLFLKKKLITEIVLTIEPKIFGTGLSIFAEDINADLQLLEHRRLNENTLMLKYKIIYPQ